jgi:formiminotetrahydrofolate cyclodeaminase
LADSAFKGGLLNINVNLRSIKEKNFLRKMKFLLKQSEKKRDMLMNEIIRSLWKIKTLK